MSIVLTHGYFIEEDEKEQEIMRPYPPLGLLYVSAYLEQQGVQHEVLDSTFSSEKEWFNLIEKQQPRVIALYTNLMTKVKILELAKTVSECGASSLHYTIVRLNGAIGPLFEDWVQKNYPDRAAKVLHQIMDCHGGKLSDNRYGKRMRGEGNIAKNIASLFRLARLKYFKGKEVPAYNYEEFYQRKQPQLKLF